MQEIGKFNKTINVIPNNMEKYMAFMISDLVFIDSFQFISSSLIDLANNFPKDGFRYIKQEFGSASPSPPPLPRPPPTPRFNNKTAGYIPTKNEFYSKLSDERISITDYKHAQTIWTTFNCKTMADYHDLYLKTDVLILADVF